MEMWEQFTGHARRAILLAHQEATNARAGKVGTEHLLLGVLGLKEGDISPLLTAMGVDLASLYRTLKDQHEAPAAEEPAPHLTFTREAQQALHCAWERAEQAERPYVSTEHILMGLVQEGSGAAYRALREYGVDLSKVEDAVQRHEEIEMKALEQSARETLPSRVADLESRVGLLSERVLPMLESWPQRHLRLARVYLYLFLIGAGFLAVAALAMSLGHEALMAPMADWLNVRVYDFDVEAFRFLAFAKFCTLALGMAALYHYLNARALRQR